jgi:hypothetical protein
LVISTSGCLNSFTALFRIQFAAGTKQKEGVLSPESEQRKQNKYKRLVIISSVTAPAAAQAVIIERGTSIL